MNDTDDPRHLDTELPSASSTEEELRVFWSTHDSAPYFEAMEDVTAAPPTPLGTGPGRSGSRARRRPAGVPLSGVTVEIPDDIVAVVMVLAAERNASYQSLLRSWIIERVDQERTVTRS